MTSRQATCVVDALERLRDGPFAGPSSLGSTGRHTHAIAFRRVRGRGPRDRVRLTCSGSNRAPAGLAPLVRNPSPRRPR